MIQLGRESEFWNIFFQVTCGSVIKLQNLFHKIRLHSHDVKYGSGSGQQSVTGVESKEDVNSHWSIKGKKFILKQDKLKLNI